jgi:hypothetical protein
MSMFDKIVAAVTPTESAAARREARAKAMNAATPGDWLSTALEHHLRLEGAFAAVDEATDGVTRSAALKQLAILLTGHTIAEEAVLYPALALAGEKGHAGTGYTEQATVKTQMAELESLAPMSQDFLDKLEQIRAAVAHHMYEEEGTWFLEIKEKVPFAQQDRLSQRYLEEFERYTGEDLVPDGVATRGARASLHTVNGGR